MYHSRNLKHCREIASPSENEQSRTGKSICNWGEAPGRSLEKQLHLTAAFNVFLVFLSIIVLSSAAISLLLISVDPYCQKGQGGWENAQ